MAAATREASDAVEAMTPQMSETSLPLSEMATGSRQQSRTESGIRREARQDSKEFTVVSMDTPSTMASTQATSSVGNCEAVIKPLLKVSPPTPYGSNPGRYKVALRRATAAQPFGVPIEYLWEHGPVVISEDEERLGLRKGDEVVRINGRRPGDLREAQQTLDTAINVELILQHHETGFHPSAGCMDAFDGYDVCQLRCGGQKKVFKVEHQMRQLLATSGPVQLQDGSFFAVQIARASLMQPFGLVFEDGLDQAVSQTKAQEKDEDKEMEEIELEDTNKAFTQALCISKDLPQYGLRAGDRVVSINNHSNVSSAEAEALLERAVNVWVECHREDMIGHSVCEALLFEDLDVDPVQQSSCWGDASRQTGTMRDNSWQEGGLGWLIPRLLGTCCTAPSADNRHSEEEDYVPVKSSTR